MCVREVQRELRERYDTRMLPARLIRLAADVAWLIPHFTRRCSAANKSANWQNSASEIENNTNANQYWAIS
jgi:hypothetical protein